MNENMKQIYEDTYRIADVGFLGAKVYFYLLVGKEKALLIDNGYGLLDLKNIIKEITPLETIFVCTHGHVDHALGAPQFETSYLHSADFDVYKKHTDPDFIEEITTKGLLFKPSKRFIADPNRRKLVEKVKAKEYPLPLPLETVTEFDLGNRVVKWLPVQGHTQGSVVFIDEKYNTIFDGDAAAPGAWLYLEESSPLPQYVENLKKYLAFMEEHNIEKRYVAHTSKMVSRKRLKQLIDCAKTAIAKPKKGIKLKGTLGHCRIVFAKGSLLFCPVSETKRGMP